MNNKGFAVSGILYTILLVFLSLLVMILFDLQNKKNLLDEMKEETSNRIEFNCPFAKIAACNTQYIPEDTSWKVNTVQEALDDLRRNNADCSININQEYLFDYTGSEQKFVVPCSGKYKVELWGAQGGGNTSSGKGAYTSGKINLNISSNLYIYVGNMPMRTENSYNGGGQANNTYYPTDDGGGATDIRIINGNWNESSSLKSRIMVASAGGGYEGFMTGTQGGSGGGLIGYDGFYTTPSTYGFPTGATQISGGLKDNKYTSLFGENGIFGIGGNGEPSYGGGGGGAGYYGGGGGTNGNHVSSGAGGSSYISGHTGCVAITSESDINPKSGCTTGTTDNSCSLHYSNYKFTETVMIDGEGYSWTNTKGSKINMPTHDGASAMTGNTGNGYAKITYLGK